MTAYLSQKQWKSLSKEKRREALDSLAYLEGYYDSPEFAKDFELKGLNEILKYLEKLNKKIKAQQKTLDKHGTTIAHLTGAHRMGQGVD